MVDDPKYLCMVQIDLEVLAIITLSATVGLSFFYSHNLSQLRSDHAPVQVSFAMTPFSDCYLVGTAIRTRMSGPGSP